MTASNENLIPPGGSPEQLFSPSEASGDQAGRFSFKNDLPGYDTLAGAYQAELALATSFAPNAKYEKYLKMHKVLVGQRGGEELESIYENLQHESMPRFLAAAGSAAIESALAQPDADTDRRLALIEGGANCWRRALATQQQFNGTDKQHLVEYAFPHRQALDLAFVPLYQDMVFGNVRESTLDTVYRDALNVAQSNAVRINLMKKEDNISGLGEHVGLGFECNALLAFNRKRSSTWFAVPAMSRSDTGYYYRDQTHDLQIVHQKWGNVQSVVPVEIKSRASTKQRERYKALFVRGKMHLSVIGRHKPEETLEAITVCEEGGASSEEAATVAAIEKQLNSMVKAYYAGRELKDIHTEHTRTSFRDNAHVGRLALQTASAA